MIDNYNITIENKKTKKIIYTLVLDDEYWYKSEIDSGSKQIYFENSSGDWVKKEYDNEGKRIYFENNYGIIKDDR